MVLNKETIAKLHIDAITPKYSYIKTKFKPHNKQFTDIISAAANKHDVDEKLIHAIIQAESSYDPTAVSNKGAIGLMQLMPNTAIRFGCTDRNDPKQNVNGGTKYLKYLIKLFDSNLKLVVAAYNAGEGAVMKYNNTIPPYSDTKQYVNQVLSIYNAS